MTSVPGLHVVEHPPRAGGGPDGPVAPVVLVHGSLDRGDSFRRVVRRLPGMRVITYDRRGYQRSRSGRAPAGLGGHVDDLLSVVEAAGAPVVAVGHSLGGDVVVGGALAEPRRFSAIGAFEPPMPWLGFHRTGAGPRPMADDPGDEVERFFTRMVGASAWERLSEEARLDRRADGPALVSDLRGLGTGAPFDVTALAVPIVVGRGGLGSADHHRATVGWLAEHVPGAALFEIPGAGHGAHLSHPDGFAAFVQAAVLAAVQTTVRQGIPADRAPVERAPRGWEATAGGTRPAALVAEEDGP